MPTPSNHRAQFIAARDSRNRRIPGLYLRGDRYYAQLWVDVGNGKKTSRKFSLWDGDNQPVQTLSAAREALEIKRHERRENLLLTFGHRPLFRNYCATYFEKAKVQRKRPNTVAGEREALARWCHHLGHVRIDQIATPLISSYIDKRLKGGKFNGRKLPAVSERTANLDMIRLRNVLKSAIDNGYIRELPRIKMLDEAPPPKRDFVTPMQFDRVAANAYVLSFKSFRRVSLSLDAQGRDLRQNQVIHAEPAWPGKEQPHEDDKIKYLRQI